MGEEGQGERQQRGVTLGNGLKTLIVSDPAMTKSAAAVDIAVGSLADPSDHMGLAHFVEHMLFLGNRRYPGPEEFTSFLAEHQGNANAYTGAENTNYHFDVGHSAFAGACDRLAQFFVAPLWKPELVEREREAIHSEHQKNLLDDNWRCRRVMQRLYAPEHPRRKFSTGDRNTLAETDASVLNRFFEEGYTVPKMRLTMMGRLPLDELATLAEESFGQIPARGAGVTPYTGEPFAKGDLPRLVQIRTVRDWRKLVVQFPCPDRDLFWRSKPGDMLCHLIGHEGEGSLLAALKDAGWAVGLSAWVENHRYGSLLSCEVTLTEGGMERWRDVLSAFFHYAELLREGLPPFHDEERQQIAHDHFRFRERREGAGFAAALAARLHVHEPEVVEENDSLVFDRDPEALSHFVALIDHQRALVQLQGQDVAVDQKEDDYGAEYSVSPLPELPANALPGLALPEANPFVPKGLDWFSGDAGTDEVPAEEDLGEWGRLWHAPREAFRQPRGFLRLVLQSSAANRDAHAKARALLYAAAASEQINLWAYDATVAGLQYQILRTDEGLQLDLAGFLPRIPTLLEGLLSRLRSPDLREKIFEGIKEELQQDIANNLHDAAYSQAVYQLRDLSYRDRIHRERLYAPEQGRDEIGPLTREDLTAFAGDISRVGVEGIVFGGFAAEELAGSWKKLPSWFEGPLPEAQRPRPRVIVYPAGENSRFDFPHGTNNHCWAQRLQMGEREPRRNAVVRIGHALLRTAFFQTLRTEQQLGYVVHCGLDFDERMLALLFLIQSAEYDPGILSERAQAWIESVPTLLREVTAERFAATRAAVCEELRQREATMHERFQTLATQALALGGAFRGREKVADTAEEVTQEEVVAAFTEAVQLKGAGALTVTLWAEGTAPPSAADFARCEAFRQRSEILSRQ